MAGRQGNNAGKRRMRRIVRTGLAGAMLMLAGAGACAQENLEQGKSGAQLYATDCAICHKSVQALLREGYPTEGFLRVHYTSSREMAAEVFAYLRGVAKTEAAAESRPKRAKSRAKRDQAKKD